MKPICYVAHDTNSTNGWGRVSREIVRAAQDLSIPHHLLSNDRTNCSKSLLMPVTDQRLKTLYSRIDAYLTKNIVAKCSIIHCLTEPMIPFALAAHNRSSLPLFLNLYGTYSVKLLHGRLAPAYRSAYLKAQKIFVSSEYTASRILREVPDIKEKLEVVTLGSSFPKCEAIASYNERDRSALFVGEIKNRKGVLQLIKAGSIAIRNRILSKIVIVGKIIDKDYFELILATINELKIEDKVTFLGTISDERLSQLYSSCLVTVLASIPEGDKFEGFGLVHSESFAHGTPSIGCYNSGSESAICNMKNGLLVESENVEQLYKAIELITSSKDRWESFSNQAQSSYRCWREVVECYLSNYSSSSSSSDSPLSAGGTLIPA